MTDEEFRIVKMWVNEILTEDTPAKTQKTENSDLHGFEVHRLSSMGTKLLLQLIKAIINQSARGVRNIFQRVGKYIL